jgi:hypothetical protein
MNKYPQYYEVDDVYVVVNYDSKTDEVYAKTKSGADFFLHKILNNGRKITKEEYTKG